MRELDASTFDDAIAEGTVVVDFWAPWCKPCHAIEPILDDLARSASAVAFVKLNIDEHPEIAARYEVLVDPDRDALRRRRAARRPSSARGLVPISSARSPTGSD